MTLATAAETEALGAAVARALRRSEAVCLRGELGAGKTTLARGMIRELAGPDEEAPSPTFTLVQFYEGPAFPLAHFDLYRLTSAAEVYEIGLDEALDQGAAVIEWPERLGDALPPDRLDVDIAFSGPGRTARLTGHGSWRDRGVEF